MKAEYRKGCRQRDSVEREGYAGARSIETREGKERDGAESLMERILNRDNLNRAYKRVKRNHGALGIDGMTVEEALPWLRENRYKLLQSIREGRYKPSPVRRKEIPKPDGRGVRKLGIPTTGAMATAWDEVRNKRFEKSKYTRSKDMAMRSKSTCPNTSTRLNHDILLNLLRKRIQDKRVIDLIKKYLKSGVMENGICRRAEEGSPQGGPLSPILANVYLNEYDQEMESRGVGVIRYADDIVVMAKSKRAATRLLESSRRYLEGKLKLQMNMQKSKVVSVVAQKHFKFLGFELGKNGKDVYVRVHRQSLAKAKKKLKELTSRSQGRNARQ